MPVSVLIPAVPYSSSVEGVLGPIAGLRCYTTMLHENLRKWPRRDLHEKDLIETLTKFSVGLTLNKGKCATVASSTRG